MSQKMFLISQIVTLFDVRLRAGADDEEQVAKYAALMAAGAIFPPVKLIALSGGTYALKDGRTRLGAAKANGSLYISGEVEAETSRAQSIADAFNANGGGPKPTTFADLRLTVEQLLLQGWKNTKIQDALSSEAPDRVKRALREASSILNSKRMAQAKRAVSYESVSVEAAAIHFNVNAETLRAELAGKVRPVRFAKKEAALLTKQHKAAKQALTRLEVRIHKAFDDGADFSELESLYEKHLDSLERQMSSIRESLLRLQKRSVAVNGQTTLVVVASVAQ